VNFAEMVKETFNMLVSPLTNVSLFEDGRRSDRLAERAETIGIALRRLQHSAGVP
jgi:hypothetical protein